MSRIIPHIMFCAKCVRYTLKLKCPACMAKTHDPKPLKYSPEDKFGVYRRMAKMQCLSESVSGGE